MTRSGSTNGYARPARKSLSSALRARGGITRPSVGAEESPPASNDAAPSTPEGVEEAVQEEAEDSTPAIDKSDEAEPAQPGADRTASAPLPVLEEEEEEESATIPAVQPVAEPVDPRPDDEPDHPDVVDDEPDCPAEVEEATDREETLSESPG